MLCSPDNRERSMKNVGRFIIFTIALIGLATAHAANPREELKQLTAQLQGNPTDPALREKIIKLARTTKLAPAIPAEAERFDGRGEYAFKSAKSEADYLAAGQEFEKASNAAPWFAPYYFNAGTAYEKAQRPAEAKRNFEFYLVASPNAQDARDVRRKISGLEFSIEKANSPEAQAAKKREQEEALIRGLEGAVFVRRDVISDGRDGYVYEGETAYQIGGGQVIETEKRIRAVGTFGNGLTYDGQSKENGRYALNGRMFTKAEHEFARVTGEISPDGRQIVVSALLKADGRVERYVYDRRY